MLDTALALLPLTLPLLYLAGAATARAGAGWPAGRLVTTTALLLALMLAAAAVTPLGPAVTAWLAPSPASLVIAALVALIGFVILRYSERHLAGEPHQALYLSAMLLTLAAVVVTVIADHLLALLGGWVLISLGLHRLLLFYPDRPRAVLATHKKFLFARVAEMALLGAILLLASHHGTWRISEIVAAYPVAALSAAEQWAAVLIALAALVKCAQMPMHGWLMQVVEAPTPVSALLHAGVINLGGYLLILFGPLLAQATAAQWLVLVVAGLTTLAASLIMTTRVSVKVKLAWSTCAQMGLMLVECALGLYELALLHLVAHSAFKAHAFLSAGSAVDAALLRRLAPAPRANAARLLGALTLALPPTLAAAWLLGPDGPYSPWLLVLAAGVIVIAERGASLPRALLTATLLALAYAGQKALAGTIVPAADMSAGWTADLWTGSIFLALTLLYMLLRYRPDHAVSRWLAVRLFAGFYLDEWVTRTTLRIWPVRLPAGTGRKGDGATTKEVTS